jgi:ADP-ribosylglycohydrolase
LLAALFARRYVRRPDRGYGATAHDILHAIGQGDPWQQAAQAAFNGEGSMGNGAAMRAGPIGAYFAEDLDKVVEQARASAQVTHAHAEGQAGAIAVAVAVAMACRYKTDNLGQTALLQATFSRTPSGDTRDGIAKALTIPFDYAPASAAAALGNGSRVISSDTVPFSLWCAARHVDDYESAMWTTVSALGDRDTTCAIVGSIVVMSAGWDSIPAAWLEAREALI